MSQRLPDCRYHTTTKHAPQTLDLYIQWVYTRCIPTREKEIRNDRQDSLDDSSDEKHKTYTLYNKASCGIILDGGSWNYIHSDDIRKGFATIKELTCKRCIKSAA